MSKMDNIPVDILARIAPFLLCSELVSLLCSNKYYYSHLDHDAIWHMHISQLPREMVSEIHDQVMEQRVRERGVGIGRNISMVAEGMLKRSQIGIGELQNITRVGMEGHAACLLLDRFMCIVTGWGPSHMNKLTVYDTSCAPQLQTIPTRTQSNARFKYGFTVLNPFDGSPPESRDLIPSWKNSLLMFGGVCEGGYSADCNELHRIALNFLVLGRGDTEFRPIVDADSTALRALPPESKLTIEAIFHNPYQPRRNPASDTRLASSAAVDDMDQRQVRQRLESREFVPSTRGYHSAIMVNLREHPCMLVWGGIHNGESLAALEIYDLVDNTWRQEFASGVEPCARFGHSCVRVTGNGLSANDYSLQTLIFTGGSDGSDLWRNGAELMDIHVLTITSNAPSFTNATSSPRSSSVSPPQYSMAWSRPQLLSLPGFQLSTLLPGRCHSAVSMGSRVLVFGGGGAASSNNFTLLDFDSPINCADYGRATLGQQDNNSDNDDEDTHGTAPAVDESIGDAMDAITDDDQYASNMRCWVHFAEVCALDDSLSSAEDDRIGHRSQGAALPSPRCSAVAVRRGRYMFVQGGWSRRTQEVGDFWCVDLASGSYQTKDSTVFLQPTKEVASRPHHSSNNDLAQFLIRMAGSTVGMEVLQRLLQGGNIMFGDEDVEDFLEEEDDDEEEDEEEDDEEGEN